MQNCSVRHSFFILQIIWAQQCIESSSVGEQVSKWVISLKLAVLLLTATPLIRPSLTRSAGVKGRLPHYSEILSTSSCLPPRHPLNPPIIPPSSSTPASYQRSFLSSHTYPLSQCRLIDEATFDNGIRNWGVCLVIRYYQSCLITAEEDPGQTDRVPLCIDMATDNEPLQQCTLI